MSLPFGGNKYNYFISRVNFKLGGMQILLDIFICD